MKHSDDTPAPGNENGMAAWESPSRYPYLISVRGGRPVPARKDGRYYVTAYQTWLGIWWPPAEVTVLQYDPHRDFFQEIRRAYEEAHRTPDADADAPASGRVDEDGRPDDGQVEATPTTVPHRRVVERVDSLPTAERPLPVTPTESGALGWGR